MQRRSVVVSRLPAASGRAVSLADMCVHAQRARQRARRKVPTASENLGDVTGHFMGLRGHTPQSAILAGMR